MKVFIFGFNGLDYNLCTYFKFPSLLQAEYGKVDLSNIYRDAAILKTTFTSPTFWTSFLTGLPPLKHGITDKYVPDWRNVLRKYGLKSFFDLIPKSIPIEVPMINCYFDTRREGQLYAQALITKNWRELWQMHYQHLQKVICETFKTLKSKDWQLIMVYSKLADVIGHIAYHDKVTMRYCYTQLANFVKKVKAHLPENTLTLIISDHCLTPGFRGRPDIANHANYAFYSLNQKLNLKNPKLTDLYNYILAWVKG